MCETFRMNALGYSTFIAVCACAMTGGATTTTVDQAAPPPIDLTCEYLADPVCIDAVPPRLGWKLTDSRRGARQSAYRVLVATSEAKLAADAGDVWDSGKINSDATVGIVCGGAPLKSRDRCWWKVKVWDRNGAESPWSRPARWSMGLLDRSEWKALWISPPPAEPPVTAHFGYRSTAAKRADEAKWVQIDLGKTQEIDGVRLWGGWPYGPEPKGDGFPLRYKIEVSQDPKGSDAYIVVDRTQADVANPGIEAVLESFKPVRARIVRLTATRLSGDWQQIWDSTTEQVIPKQIGRKGWKLAFAEMEVLSQGTNVAHAAQVTAADSIERGAEGWAAEYLTDGRTGADPGSAYHLRPVTLFRRDFLARKRVLSATLYVTARGCYEAYLNGIRVGDDELAPGLMVRNRRVLYQTYDVSGLIRSGENVLGAMLADGWHRSRPKFDKFDNMKQYADPEKTALLAQLEMTYADGSCETIISDHSWLCNSDGPLRRTSMYDGVLVDARKEITGWNKPGVIERAGWENAAEEPTKPQPLLSAQPMPPIRVLDVLKPVSQQELRPGHYIFDFGTCLAGVCRVTLDGPSGTAVKLRHAEARQPDGRLYVANLAGAAGNADTFILAGRGPQTFQAKFTYHGFRYVEVSGVPPAASVQEISALALGSDIQKTATFSCSDDKLNQLVGIIDRAYRSNMPGLIVDVAGRDERLAFLGDCLTDEIQSLAYLYDFAAFGGNENRAILDCLTAEGIAPARLNTPGEWRGVGKKAIGEPGWSDGSITTPLALWVNYADRRNLELSYEGASRMMTVIERDNPDYVPKKKYIATWVGDWLCTSTRRSRAANRRPGAPYDLFTHAWWAYSAENVSKMAAALNKTEDASRYAEMAARIRAAFVKAHLSPEGTLTGDEQSCYALALGMHLLPGSLRQPATKKLLAAIRDNDDHLSTGSITTIFLLKALEEAGLHELAYRLVMQPTSPSYGAMIEGGATAMWEQFANWDFHHGMESEEGAVLGFNHLGMNSVFEWIFGTVAGIRPDPMCPGYKHFFIGPKTGGPVTWAESSYESVHGKIVCGWKADNETFSLHATIPPNTAATLFMPAKEAVAVTEGGRQTTDVPGVMLLRMEDGCAVYAVEAGEYRFASRL